MRRSPGPGKLGLAPISGTLGLGAVGTIELAEAAGTADVAWPLGWSKGGAQAGVAKGDRSMAPSADWFGNAMRETGSSPQRVEGAADLRVKFEGLPKGSKVDSSMEGMFRSISIDKVRSMQAPEEI